MNKLKTKNLKLNVLFNCAYQIFVLIVPFITSPYVSRVLLPEGVGSYSYALSLVTYFSLVAAFGFLDYGTSALAKQRDDRKNYSQTFFELCMAKLALTLLVCVAYVVLIMTGVFESEHYPLNTKIVFLLLGMNILVNGFDATFLFQGLEEFGPLCLRNFVVRLLNMVLIFLLVKKADDYVSYIAVMGGSNALLGVLSFVGIHRFLDKPQFRNPHILTHIRNAFIYFIPTGVVTILPIISKTLIGSIVQDSLQSGYYEQADKLITLVIAMINSLDAIMMSRMSYLYAIGDKVEIEHKTKQTLSLFLIVMIPACIGLALVNPYFTVGFFGGEYQASVPYVYALLPRLVFSPLTALLGAIYFVPSGKLWTRNLLYLSGLLSNLLLSSILIRFFSVMGCCIAYSMTEIVLCLLFVVFSKKNIRHAFPLDSFVKSIDAGLLMLIGCYFVSSFIRNRFSNMVVAIFMILVGAIVYFAFLLLFHEETVSFYFNRIKQTIVRLLHKRG